MEKTDAGMSTLTKANVKKSVSLTPQKSWLANF